MKIFALFISIGLVGCTTSPAKDQSDLGQILKERQSLSFCFRKNQLRQEDVIYQKAVEMTVTPLGKAEGVKLSSSNRRTDECLSRKLTAIEFKPREKESLLRFLINYEVQRGRGNLTLRAVE